MTFSLCRIRTALFLVPALALASLSSCRTVPGDIKQTGLSFREASAETGPEEITESTLPDSIELTFAGDIMAHTENWSMSDYSRIYQDVSSLLRNDDLTFANFETPVSNSLPLSTYPRFNVHSSYLDAAVEAGFDVFSLANNHSNDQGLAGVAETLSSFSSVHGPIYFSGLFGENRIMAPVVITKNGFRIVFIAATEILNSHDPSSKKVYYVAPTEKEREAFLQQITLWKKENPCDLFILSLHVHESEYVRDVGESRKRWSERLVDAGVDILWGHHPHVQQEWTVLDRTADTGSGLMNPLIMYSMGNFISGQRRDPDLSNPGGAREYTGDAVLLKISVSKIGENTSKIADLQAIPITTHIESDRSFVVRRFTPEFIGSLRTRRWREYYANRYALLCSYLPLLPLMLEPAILME